MNTEQILKAATPRPWGVEPEELDRHYKPAMIFGAFDSDAPKVICDMAARPNDDSNAALIVIAVNSYEAREALIADLVTALEGMVGMETCVHVLTRAEHESFMREARSALAAAKERQP